MMKLSHILTAITALFGSFILFSFHALSVLENKITKIEQQDGKRADGLASAGAVTVRAAGVPKPKQASSFVAGPANVVGEGSCHPQYPLMTADHVYSLVKLWFEANCPAGTEKARTCKFRDIGRYLLDHAVKHDLTMLKIQIGAMDGKSNDPMYEMFIKQKNWPLRKRDHFDNL